MTEVERRITVDYDQAPNPERARKRAEYLLSSKYNTDTYDGLDRRFHGEEDDFRELYEDLVQKVPEETIRIEAAERIEMPSVECKETSSNRVSVEEQSLKLFVDYWFENQAPGSEEVGDQTYVLFSKKTGRAEASYEIKPLEDGSEVRVDWKASSEDAMSHFKGLFEDELSSFEP